MLVRFEYREEIAPNIWQYYFTPERPLDYIPGQYADFHILQSIKDPRGQMRTFSLTSIPSDETISFAAKFVHPMSAYKTALQNLRVNDQLRINDAMGDVVLPKNTKVPLIFVAGGLGLASFISIIRTLRETDEERIIDLFYARHEVTDNPFNTLLEAYSFHTMTEYISPDRINLSALIAATKPESLVYVSGSERFVEGLRQDLVRLGVSHEQIIFDFFDGYIDL